MKKSMYLVLAWIFTFWILAGCSNSSNQKWLETFKIGVIAPLSGPAANYWEDAINAYQYIVNKFNSENSGKIIIEMIIEDGKCEWKSASSAAQKLINIDKVQIIVWWFCSAETIAAWPIAQANKVVMISPASSSPEIANIGNYIFRYYNDADVTKKLSNYISAQWAENIFILAENSDAMIGFLNGVKNNFTGNIKDEIYQSDEKDFNMLVKKNKSEIENSDFLIFLPNSDSSTTSIINALDTEKLLESMSWKIITNEIVNSANNYENLWNKLNGIKTTQLVNLWALQNKAKEIVTNIKKQFTITWDPLFLVLEADAMQLTVDAITQVWNDGTAIKDYFTNFNKTAPREWYFWDYYFTTERDANWLDFLVYEIQDWKLVNGK